MHALAPATVPTNVCSLAREAVDRRDGLLGVIEGSCEE